MLVCLGCDREYEGVASRGFCVICTKANLEANGLVVSLKEICNFGPAIARNPHLIVRLVEKE